MSEESRFARDADDVTVVQMPEPYFQLLREIEYHFQLVAIFRAGAGAQTPWDEIIAHTAAYCEIVLDGWYAEDRILELCDILLNKLKDKRSIIVH